MQSRTCSAELGLRRVSVIDVVGVVTEKYVRTSTSDVAGRYPDLLDLLDSIAFYRIFCWFCTYSIPGLLAFAHFIASFDKRATTVKAIEYSERY